MPENRLLPVLSLLFTATLWGVVWYPLRLLEEQGLVGAWSALISYAAALSLFLWVFVREFGALRPVARSDRAPVGALRVMVPFHSSAMA